jgi:hypothetical protein
MADAQSVGAGFTLDGAQAISVILLGVLLPLSILVGRRNVRIRRLQMLHNLRQVLLPAVNQHSLPPSFFMIEARYLDDTEGTKPWTSFMAWLKEIAIYMLPVTVFVLVSASGFALLVGLGKDWAEAGKILLYGLAAEGGGSSSFAAATGLIVGAGFVGAYIWSISYLILRIANFDLSPLSFLSTSAHILLTVFVTWVLRQVVAAPAPEGVAVAILLGIAFLSGLYPLLGLNVLIDRLPSWLRFKRDVPEAGQIGRSFPLDLIDGIDPSIKFRLNELDFGDVQNLATANPVELFVETPYSFGQIIDWMAQAQLLVELGPQRFLHARESGVRDIAAFLVLGSNDAGRMLLKPFLSTGGDPEEALEARVESVARKLHVRHLNYWSALLSEALHTPLASNAATSDQKLTLLKATN